MDSAQTMFVEHDAGAAAAIVGQAQLLIGWVIMI